MNRVASLGMVDWSVLVPLGLLRGTGHSYEYFIVFIGSLELSCILICDVRGVDGLGLKGCSLRKVRMMAPFAYISFLSTIVGYVVCFHGL